MRDTAPRIASCFAIAGALVAVAIPAAKAALPGTIEALAIEAVARLDRAPVIAAPAPPAPPPQPAPEISFVTPVTGHDVDSPFGLRRLPWEDHARLHAGVDIAAPLGTMVMACADGVVTKVGNSPSYGHYLEVAHVDGLNSFYAHLSHTAKGAKVGVAMKRGETVGFVGNTGDSTGPHLHFEIRNHTRPLNPLLFVDRSFAKAADLPLTAAARVGGHVRIAAVSRIPASKLGGIRLAADSTTGRVRGVIRF